MNLPLSFAGLVQVVGTLIFKKRLFDSKSVSEKFFKLLDKKFDLGLIENKSDILVLAESFKRERSVSYEFASLLEDYLKYLIKIVENGNNKEKIKIRCKKIKEMYDKENEEKPFANVPEEERRLLQFLKEAVDSNKVKLANDNLEDLRILISTRHKTYERNRKINRWAVPLAIFGLIATLIFGSMSIFNSIDYDKIENTVKKVLSENN